MSTHREVDPHHGFRSGNKEKHGVIMTDTFKADTLNAARLPNSTLAWNLFGEGTDNLGRSELKQDSGFFEHLETNNETRVSTNT